MSEPVIVCEHLYVAYGRDVVLDDVCLKIEKGVFLPFVGPNGAGKTTLLRTILGLVKPQRGRVIAPFRRSPPGYVPQQKSIDPLYPVSANQIVTMGLYREIGWWRRLNVSQKDRVQRALEQFDLGNHAHKNYAQLSGGMKQKVLLARAFVSGAEILVMDEPASELDEQSEKEVMSHLLRLNKKEGKTVLLALHGQSDLVEELPNFCMVQQGRVRLIGKGNLQDLGELGEPDKLS